MIETYLTNREQLKAVVLIVDLRHPPTADDVMMYDFLKHYGIPCIIINTKADKVPKIKMAKTFESHKRNTRPRSKRPYRPLFIRNRLWKRRSMVRAK